MTRAQRRAIEGAWPTFGVDGADMLDLDALFGRRAPRVLEIGFGMGEALVAMARDDPDRDYLGVEVYEPGIGATLAAIVGLGLGNVRLLRGDAEEVLRARIPDASMQAVLLYFPDPWPKKRHHKRRLVKPEFVRTVAGKLEPGGRISLATDWQDYARHMLSVLEADPGFENVAGPGCYSERPAERPETKFERRGERLGHPVWDLVFACKGEA
jgi:tRNA (guanine-N7-)-methyltransferase